MLTAWLLRDPRQRSRGEPSSITRRTTSASYETSVHGPSMIEMAPRSLMARTVRCSDSPVRNRTRSAPVVSATDPRMMLARVSAVRAADIE